MNMFIGWFISMDIHITAAVVTFICFCVDIHYYRTCLSKIPLTYYYIYGEPKIYILCGNDYITSKHL